MSENVNCIFLLFTVIQTSQYSLQYWLFLIFYKFLFIHEEMKITLKLMAGFALYRKMCANRLFK